MARYSRYGTHGGLIGIDVVTREVRETVNRVMINTALQIHEILRGVPPRGTPIDTRWASNNWTLSVDTPRDDAIGTKPKSGTTVLPQSSAQEVGIAAVVQFDSAKNSAIHIQNNAPYIARLNRGHSKQSPAGFVEMAIDEAMLSNGLLGV